MQCIETLCVVSPPPPCFNALRVLMHGPKQCIETLCVLTVDIKQILYFELEAARMFARHDVCCSPNLAVCIGVGFRVEGLGTLVCKFDERTHSRVCTLDKRTHSRVLMMCLCVGCMQTARSGEPQTLNPKPTSPQHTHTPAASCSMRLAAVATKEISPKKSPAVKVFTTTPSTSATANPWSRKYWFRVGFGVRFMRIHGQESRDHSKT